MPNFTKIYCCHVIARVRLFQFASQNASRRSKHAHIWSNRCLQKDDQMHLKKKPPRLSFHSNKNIPYNQYLFEMHIHHSLISSLSVLHPAFSPEIITNQLYKQLNNQLTSRHEQIDAHSNEQGLRLQNCIVTSPFADVGPES